MTFGTDTAGFTVAPTPVRVVDGLTTTDETGATVPVIPIRYVDAAADTDEIGRTIDALQVEVVDTLVATLDDGRVVSAMPVREVAGTTTTDALGRTVEVVPVWVSDGGGGDPGSPGLAFPIVSDFKSGAYTSNGSPITVADLYISDSNDWYAFDPATDITAGVGLNGDPCGPVASDALKDLLVSGGFTAVVDYIGSSGAVGEIDLVDFPGFVSDYYGQFYVQSVNNYGLNVQGSAGYNDAGTPPADTLHRVAFSFSSAGLSGSFEGAAANTVAPGDPLTTPTMAIGISAGMIIEKITYHALTADADLPALSALS